MDILRKIILDTTIGRNNLASHTSDEFTEN